MNRDTALVGNSGCILDSKDGHKIDSHEVVIRINNFDISSLYKESTGVKTNIWASSFYRDIKDRECVFDYSICPFPVTDGKWKLRYSINDTIFNKHNPTCIDTVKFEKLIKC